MKRKHYPAPAAILFNPSRTPVLVRTTVRYFGPAGAARDRAIFLVRQGTLSAHSAIIKPPVTPDTSASIRSGARLRPGRSFWAEVAQG